MDADHRILDGSSTDESSPDGIPNLFLDQIVVRIEGLESHAIGMGRHTMPHIHHHIMRVVERNTMRAVQRQLTRPLAFLPNGVHMVSIDALRHIAFQPGHCGSIGTMPQSGKRQGSI